MSEMNEYTPELFELVDDEGNKKNFELVDVAEFNGELYYALLPEMDEEDILNADCEPVILKAVEENGEEILASIEDEEEFLAVADLFMKRMEDFFDEEEEEEEM